MPIVPNIIERTTLLTLNQGPGPLLDVWNGPAFWSLQAALQLDLFAHLSTGSLTAGQLAAKVDGDPHGLRLLLHALTALGYLQQRGECYQNSAMTRKWLLPSGELDLTPFCLYWGALMQHFMPHLADSIRSGIHMDFYTWLQAQPDVSQHFQAGMVQFARCLVDDIVHALTLPATAQRLLDVGGGHGEYAVALCKHFPDLVALIFDNEQALVAGRATAAANGMDGRIHAYAGNFLHDPMPGGNDIVLVFNIAHGLTPTQNVELLRKIRASLKPNGQIALMEQVHDIRTMPLLNTVTHMMSVAYYHLIGGQVYSAEEIHQWLVAAGFVNIQRHNLNKVAGILFCAMRD